MDNDDRVYYHYSNRDDVFDRQIESLEEEIASLKKAKADGPWIFSEWEERNKKEHMGWYGIYVPSCTYDGREGPKMRWGGEEKRGFCIGEDPVVLRGCRSNLNADRDWFNKIVLRVIASEKRTMFLREEIEKYVDGVVDRVREHFKKRKVQINCRNRDDYSGKGLDVKNCWPSFLLNGKFKYVKVEKEGDIEARVSMLKAFAKIDKKLAIVEEISE